MATKDGKKTGGRQKNTPNKLTVEIRQMILGALDAVGGQEYLTKQAEENPTAFMTLLGRVVPKEIEAKVTVIDQYSARLIKAQERAIEHDLEEAEKFIDVDFEEVVEKSV
jgi:hypothetical protein